MSTLASVLAKVTSSEEETWTKEEMAVLMHWYRQLLGMILGIVCGLIPVEGALGNIVFVALTSLMVLILVRYLDVDVERLYGTVFGLLQDGFMPSFGVFLVTWITVYNQFSVGWPAH